MARLRIFPYKVGSMSARSLKLRLRDIGVDTITLQRRNSTYVPRDEDLVLNWGSSTFPSWECSNTVWINRPELVYLCSNKLAFFRAHDSRVVDPDSPRYTVDYTSDMEVAGGWQRAGFDVIERHVLVGHSGAGVRLVRPDEGLSRAPLYTKRYPSAREFRLHFVMGPRGIKLLSASYKGLRRGVDSTYVGARIRTHGNGFVFCRISYDEVDEKVPDAAYIAAHRAMQVSMLDIAAVDVLYNSHYNTARVVEINAAPGITGTTLCSYASQLEDMVNDWRWLHGRDEGRGARVLPELRRTCPATHDRMPTGLPRVGLLHD